MSADMRVMWYLKRLGTIQMVDEDLDVESPEQCKIMSFIPREENLDKDSFANSIFVMDALTRVYFLTAVYNMVYCLDMSPSNCSVVRILRILTYSCIRITSVVIYYGFYFCLGHSEMSCYA